MSEAHPVFVEVGGQRVRVGTAHRAEDGAFVLVLGGTLGIGPSEGPARAAGASSGGGGRDGGTFPPFGRMKGKLIRGAPLSDLEWYSEAVRRSVEDPTKARWRDKNEEMLRNLEAEIHRQNGGEGYTPPQNPPSDDDIPFNAPSGAQ